MKCSQCNSQTLTRVELNDVFHFVGDTYFKVSRHMDIYACNECGHLEFFDHSFNHRREKEKTIVETFDKEINALTEKQDAIMHDKVEGLQDQLVEVEEWLCSSVISMSRRQELETQSQALHAEIKKIFIELREIDEEIALVRQRKASALEELETEHNLRFW